LIDVGAAPAGAAPSFLPDSRHNFGTLKITVRILSALELESAQFWRMESEYGRNEKIYLSCLNLFKYEKRLEARVGIEPTHKGFAVYRTSRKSLRKQGTSAGRSPQKPAF
jgi:hypothetical protein